MKDLNWKPEMGTESGELNALRKELVALVNALAAAQTENDADSTDRILGRLEAYTRHYQLLAHEAGISGREELQACLTHLSQRNGSGLNSGFVEDLQERLRAHLLAGASVGSLVKIPVT